MARVTTAVVVLVLVVGLAGCTSADPSNLLAFTRYYGEVDSADIWVMDLDTGQERQVTFGKTATKAVWYDQQHLLVLSNLSLWLVDIQGKEPTKRLTSDLYVTEVCSDPKGRYVFYHVLEMDVQVGQYRMDLWSIYRIDMTTGKHELVKRDFYTLGYLMVAAHDHLFYIGHPRHTPEINHVNFSGQDWACIYLLPDLYRDRLYTDIACLDLDVYSDGQRHLVSFRYSGSIKKSWDSFSLYARNWQ